MKMADDLSTPLKMLTCMIERLRTAENDAMLMLTYAKAIGVILEEMQTEITESTVPTCQALVDSYVKRLVEKDLEALLSAPDTEIFKDD